MTYDFCIIGCGIVGLATALAILDRQPGASLLLLEKEPEPAVHQTGHNSGVIHSGIYYAPGSLKAQLCKQGEVDTKAFCAEHSIPFEVCGKLIVATSDIEEARLRALFERAGQNGIDVELLDAAETKRREPRIAAQAAIHVGSTGIVSYREISRKLCDVIKQRGGDVRFGAQVDTIRESGAAVTVRSGEMVWQSRRLIACAGLQSDRVAAMAGITLDCRIVPFRGEYFRLPSDKSDIVKHLIYPTPDPELPFLGIHVTRMIDGSITVGPNAILGLAREKYRKWAVDLRDFASIAGFPGTWRVLLKHRSSAFSELRGALSRHAYARECQKYCPELTAGDLTPIEAGIRAQIVYRDGIFAHDFVFEETPRMLHVINAPSPAATSALPIGRMIAERALAIECRPEFAAISPWEKPL